MSHEHKLQTCALMYLYRLVRRAEQLLVCLHWTRWSHILAPTCISPEPSELQEAQALLLRDLQHRLHVVRHIPQPRPFYI